SGDVKGAAPAEESPTTPKPVAAVAPRPAQAPRPVEVGTPAAGGGLYRVQVGAFLDHRNADRLVERLRADGLEVVTGLMEESRTTYRGLGLPAAHGHDGVLQR